MNHYSRWGIPFVISAPSGAGKTSICKEVRSIIPNLAYSVSYTTRPIRKGEKESEDYFFVSPEVFEDMINEGRFLEWAQVHGHYYGTSKDIVLDKIKHGLDCLLDIDTCGAKNLKKIFPDGIFVFIVAPSFHELKSRLSKRQTEDYEQIRIRTEKAFAEIQAFEEYQYLIINRDFSQAVEELKSIIIAERCKTLRRRPLIREILRS
ncbi:guanylate kinase [bacterium]|nr:guanylate kinase [bacterium]